MKIRKMDMSTRAKSCLLRAGYTDSDELEGVSDEDLLAIKNLNQKCVNEIRKALLGDSGNGEECIIIGDSDNDDVDKTDMDLFKDQLFEVLDTLTEREQNVLCLRFGLEDGKTRTLEEVGNYYDLTRERIRQIESKALRKLRHPSRFRKIRAFVIDHDLDISDILKQFSNHSLMVRKPEKYTYQSTSGSEIVHSNLTENDDVIKTPVVKLDLSVRSYNCLRRAGIDIVRDICIRDSADMMKVRNLGRKSLEEVLGRIKELGCDLRPEAEDAFLYGYPEYVKDIIKNKPKGWEYRLYIEIMILNYEWLTEFSKEEADFWKNDYDETTIDSNAGIRDFITEKLEAFKEYTHEMSEAMNEKAADAFGEPGEPGDVEKIVYAAEEFFSVYRKWMRWKISFSKANAVQKYHRIIKELYSTADGVLSCVDELYGKLVVARKTFEDYDNRIITLEEINIDLQVSFSVDMDGFNSALEAIISGDDDDDNSADETDDEFEDIEIHERDSKAQIIIEFCGLEFDEFSETVTIRIWANSWSEDTYKIWIKDLMVNNQQYESIDLIGTIEDNERGYLEEEITDVDGTNYDDIRSLSFVIEIDDENNKELANSRIVYVSCDTQEETFKVERIEDYVDDDDDQPDNTEITLESDIEELELSIRSYNCLKRAGVNTIGDLCRMTPSDLMKVRILGRKSCDEIISKLNKLGLSLSEEEDDLDEELP